MKKALSILMLILAALCCAACSSGGSNAGKTSATVPVVLNQAEYVLYQNIFGNQEGSEYVNKPVTKNGVFAILRDAYNNRDRYYVWGYLDSTLCCDWQWEFVPKNTASLPTPGSLVTVTGTFAEDSAALDGYWIIDAQVEAATRYTGEVAQVDMRTMSDTLERVQVINIINKTDFFEGKTFSAYGRILSLTELQDPYYDGSWRIPYTTAGAAPGIGVTVEARGTIKGSALADCAFQVME